VVTVPPPVHEIGEGETVVEVPEQTPEPEK
jgi:hypothetical protein